jgi:hypothetical protein
MPEKRTRKRAAKKKTASGKAGEYVREEIEHVREGKHGARSAKQAIAIGLSKARRAGVKVKSRPGAKKTKATGRKPNPRRSRATSTALKREGRSAASHRALSRHAKSSARKRGSASRHRAAQKAARTRRAGKKSSGAPGRKRASSR